MTDNLMCKSIYTGTIAASSSDTGKVLKNQAVIPFFGYFSIQPIFTGSGTLKIGYQVSNDGVTWSPEVTIVDGATTGTVYPYPAGGVNSFSGWQRLVFTETGTANPIVITEAHRCAV